MIKVERKDQKGLKIEEVFEEVARKGKKIKRKIGSHEAYEEELKAR